MMEQPERLIGGIKVMLSMFPNAKGVIGIEENKPEAIKLLEGLVKDEPKITVCPLKTKYPQGGERFLIYAVTGGREINSTMLPADAGCIVDNVDTVISIYNAVCESTPLIRKIITVTGDAVKNPQNFQVPLGMCYREILEAAGGFKEEPEKDDLRWSDDGTGIILSGYSGHEELFCPDLLHKRSGCGKSGISVYSLWTLYRGMSWSCCPADDDGGSRKK